MRYLAGPLADMHAVRAAIDQLVGLPKPVLQIQSPPRAAEYSEGAFGWIGHLMAEPFEIGDGRGMLACQHDLLGPYYGQTATVDGQSVTVPDANTWVDREHLAPDLDQWLKDNIETTDW